MIPTAPSVTAIDLLEEACEWRMLSLLLSRPDAATKDAVRRLAAEVHNQALADIARGWCDSAVEGAYLALLGPGGLVSPRVVAYRGFADPGWMLADIARYQEAFGFHPQREESPDHVAALAELVSYLWLKEAYARELGDEDAVTLTRSGRDRFIEEYLAPLAAPIAERLDNCGATAWSAAAHVLAGKVPAPSPQVPGIGESVDPLQCEGCLAHEPDGL